MKVLYTSVAIVVLCCINTLCYSQNVSVNYTSPIDGAEYINPEQTIILKTGYSFDESSINTNIFTIAGSESGNLSYKYKLSKDKKTLILIPDEYFLYGETITFNLNKGLLTSNSHLINETSVKFKIKPVDNLPLLKEYYKQRRENERVSVISNETHSSSRGRNDFNTPDDYPGPVITNYIEPIEKYLFFTLDNRAGALDYDKYLSINDEYGTPIFYRETTNNCLYFHKLSDGRLAYSRNEYGSPENERYFFMDSSYMVIDSVKTGNGYDMDGHDILLLENGNYLLMSYDPQPVDMSLIVLGGNPNATVIGLVIQEVDIDENVYFQWRSWDHFQITDATDDINLLGANIDYVHGNAFEFDTDGHLLISSRHLDEITKINYQTGDIIYRFGLNSKNNEFEIGDDSFGFSHQHDVRLLPNGNITIYDNGNLHPDPFSRALEYSIDGIAKTATLVWFYRNDPDIYGPSTGTYRRDEEGNSLIGWGTTWPISATELLPNNDIASEISLPDGAYSYRVIKSGWRTNLFTSLQQLNFGNYAGYSELKKIILPVSNNSDHQISISSIFLHTDNFQLVDDFPIIINPNDTVEVFIGFEPEVQGSFTDKLTLNYDKNTLTKSERIAIQVHLSGIWDNSIPEVSFIPGFGQKDVGPESSVKVNFSEPVRNAGGELITSDDIPNLFTFKKNNQWGTDVSFQGTISEDRLQITLYPETYLDEQQYYFVELIPSVIESDSEVVISYPESTYFETGLFVDINQNSNTGNIDVFPVPFKNELVIVNSEPDSFSVNIYSSTGSVVFQSNSIGNSFIINTEHLPSGVYFVKIVTDNDEIKVSKVIKSST